MTVRAEKSTRFPIKFPRMRPSLPFSRCRMVLRGFPPLCFSCTPSLALASLSNNALTLYCNNSSNWGDDVWRLARATLFERPIGLHNIDQLVRQVVFTALVRVAELYADGRGAAARVGP